MRVSNNGKTTVIDGDEVVVARAASIDMNAPYWEYVGSDGELVRVDVSAHRTNMDVLSRLYQKAYASGRSEDAAGYVRHKARVLALLN
ncbi:hypothetical protein [Cohnella lupini]|uniref:Uncharacterized protein n=1 Tax=Cohnella lupini TaxID=1294267 RepID=A0A3D9I676_9BACL|nr:hypothetical protein [Cohnella lupini]RED57170.1 hypothetical protein DFP95_11184 [Cohnella lupini]